MNCSAYLLKPITEEKIRNAAANLRYPVFDEKRVELRCFGNFEAFCDGSPIQFKYNRTKELLAYLTDRNGTRCSMKERSAVLFENDQHRSYMYQIRLDLVNTLGGWGWEIFSFSPGAIWKSPGTGSSVTILTILITKSMPRPGST